MATAVATSVVDHVMAAANTPVVDTKYGAVQGFTIDLENRSKADIFLGVPFAKPPTGELKYERPQPPTPWEGVYQADKFKDECEPLFVHPEVVSASDDSLYLNIFAPSDKSMSYSVLVIIHGGGFAFGSAMHYRDSADLGNNFVSKGIVVVAIQYRLGVYGFASTGDASLPGNLGLWDQVAALKFIQENIRNFGGDPDRVTLYGYSAGAASVSALALSPHSRDLFHQAIQMSGSAFSQWAMNDITVEATKELARTLGCESGDSSDIKRCLKEATRDDVRAAVLKMGPTAVHLMLDKWAPRIDGDLFPSTYDELSKNAPKKPTYMGVVEEECYVWTILTVAHGAMHMLGIPPQDQTTYGEEQFRQFVHNVVVTERDFGSQAEEVRQKVLGFYVKTQNGEKKDNVFYLKKYTQLCSDLMWNIPALKEAHTKVEHGWPVYLYKHSYLHEHPLLAQAPYTVAFHSHDHRFIFRGDNHIVRAMGWDLASEDDHDVADYLVNSLVTFVKTGSPSTKDPDWLPATTQKPSLHMEIDVPRVMRDALFDDRLKFWDSIAATYGFDVVSGRTVNRKMDRKPSDDEKGSTAEPQFVPKPKPELGTRPAIATSFSDRMPRERVSDYAGRQYMPSASHRSVGYRSWLGTTPAGSVSYATRLVDRPRSRTLERRRETDYRRSPSPSAGYYGGYYGSYLTNRTPYSAPMRTRDYSIPASVSRTPSLASYRDYRAESSYKPGRTPSSDRLSRSSYVSFSSISLVSDSANAYFDFMSRGEINQWDAFGDFAREYLFRSMLTSQYSAHVRNTYKLHGRSYGR